MVIQRTQICRISFAKDEKIPKFRRVPLLNKFYEALIIRVKIFGSETWNTSVITLSFINHAACNQIH